MTNPYLGIGLYSIPEAARLLRARAGKLRRWANGYTFWHKDARRASPPLLDRRHPELAGLGVLTFLDLVELNVVQLLRLHGVSLKTVRDAACRLAKKHSTDHPFAVAGIATDGSRIFDNDFEELGRYQQAMETMVRPFLRQLEYDEDEAKRIWPIGRGRVVLDPKRNFGKPIVAAEGVPTVLLYQTVLAGESHERVAEWFGVPVRAVSDAVEYEKTLELGVLS